MDRVTKWRISGLQVIVDRLDMQLVRNDWQPIIVVQCSLTVLRGSQSGCLLSLFQQSSHQFYITKIVEIRICHKEGIRERVFR
jgi:hypothetical protein